MGVMGTFTGEMMVMERECPVCHHRYVVYPWQNWVYKFKKKGKYTKIIPVCSWHCLRELEKIERKESMKDGKKGHRK